MNLRLSALIVLIAGASVHAELHTIDRNAVKASMDIPKHELITISKSAGFLFFSVKAGYEQPDNGPYSNIPAEMNIRIVEGPMEKAVENSRKININTQREILREIKRDDQIIWLVKDKSDTADRKTNRAFQFVPSNGQVFIIDVTGQTLRGMPPANKKIINDLLGNALKSIRLSDKTVNTTEVQQHVFVK